MSISSGRSKRWLIKRDFLLNSLDVGSWCMRISPGQLLASYAKCRKNCSTDWDVFSDGMSSYVPASHDGSSEFHKRPPQTTADLREYLRAFKTFGVDCWPPRKRQY